MNKFAVPALAAAFAPPPRLFNPLPPTYFTIAPDAATVWQQCPHGHRAHSHQPSIYGSAVTHRTDFGLLEELY